VVAVAVAVAAAAAAAAVVFVGTDGRGNIRCVVERKRRG
jgi:hypothetical protein